MTSGEPHEMSLILGRLLANQDTADKTCTEIFNKLDHISKNVAALGQSMIENKRDHAVLAKAVTEEIMPTIKSVKSLQAKGVGLIAGVGLTAGGIGAFIIKIASNLGIGAGTH